MPAILTLKIDKIFFRRLTDGTRRFEEMSKWQTDRRNKYADCGIKHRDIFEKLLRARDIETGKRLTIAELNAEAIGLIIAGRINRTLITQYRGC